MTSRRALLSAADGLTARNNDTLISSPGGRNGAANPFEVTMIDHTGRHSHVYAESSDNRRGSRFGDAPLFERRPSTAETTFTSVSLRDSKSSWRVPWYKLGLATILASAIWYHSFRLSPVPPTAPLTESVQYVPQVVEVRETVIERPAPGPEEIENLIQSYLPSLVKDLKGELAVRHAQEEESVNTLKERYHKLQERMEFNVARFSEVSARLQRIEGSQPDEVERSAVYEAELKARDEATRHLERQIAEMSDEMRALRKQSGDVEERLYQALRDEELLRREVENFKKEQSKPPPPSPVTTVVKEIVIKSEPPLVAEGANFALRSLGTLVVKKFTTRPASKTDQYMGKLQRAVAEAIPSGRYVSLIEEDVKSPDVVLDETPVRGPGDCYKVIGNEANITLHLPFPIIVKGFEVEHVRRNLDQSPGTAPIRVEVFGTRVEPHHKALPMSATMTPPSELLSEFQTDFGTNTVAKGELIDRPPRVQRVRFNVKGAEQAATLCVYRVRVYGVVQDSG